MSIEGTGAKKKLSKRKPNVVVNLSACKYAVVAEAVLKMDWKTSNNEKQKDFNIWWQDWSVGPERVMKLESFQRLNHFPGMYQICRKGDLARSICRMKRCFGREFSLVPRSWVLPEAFSSFKAYILEREKKGQRKRPIIIKPVAACQGKGIFLTNTFRNVSSTDAVVAQHYITRPLLIDGLKFDLRIYALVTSVDPLRILIYEEGIVRLCTVKYKEPTTKNMGQTRMHLTNYAINKASGDFVQAAGADDAEDGTTDASKRSLNWFFGWLKSRGLDPENTLWKRICDLVVKTLVSVQPSLKHTYRSCVPEANSRERTSSTSCGGGYTGSHPYRLASPHSSPTSYSKGAGSTSPGGRSAFFFGAGGTEYGSLSDDRGVTPHPSRCFEILGFDVLVDRKLRPWLLEVNHSPSFGCDSSLDHSIKQGLIESTLRLLGLNKSDRRQWQAAMQAQAQSRLYKGVNPLATYVPPQNPRQTSAADYAFPSAAHNGAAKTPSDAKRKWEKHLQNEQKVLQNCRYSVIFPSSDSLTQKKYDLMLQAAEDMFHHGSDTSQVSQVQMRIAQRLADINASANLSSSFASLSSACPSAAGESQDMIGGITHTKGEKNRGEHESIESKFRKGIWDGNDDKHGDAYQGSDGDEDEDEDDEEKGEGDNNFVSCTRASNIDMQCAVHFEEGSSAGQSSASLFEPTILANETSAVSTTATTIASHVLRSPLQIGAVPVKVQEDIKSQVGRVEERRTNKLLISDCEGVHLPSFSSLQSNVQHPVSSSPSSSHESMKSDIIYQPLGTFRATLATSRAETVSEKNYSGKFLSNASPPPQHTTLRHPRSTNLSARRRSLSQSGNMAERRQQPLHSPEQQRKQSLAPQLEPRRSKNSDDFAGVR